MQETGDTSKADRLRGMLIGLAVGDALGAAVEFMPPGSFESVAGYRAGGPHELAAGEWTDDAAMALALADSLAGRSEFDIDDQARRYLDWMQNGRYSVNGHCFDIGIQTRRALEKFAETGDAEHSGDVDEFASGNGSIMRLAPVPIRYAWLAQTDPKQLAEYCGQSSVPTHPSAQCRSACRWLGVALATLALGEPRERVLDSNWPMLAEIGPLEQRIDSVVRRAGYRRKSPPEIVGGGWVVTSLEAALWAFHDAPDFSTAVLRAVNLGDDADTTGAVCGQLAGAYFGESGIPVEWREELAHREMIETALDDLISAGKADSKFTEH